MLARDAAGRAAARDPYRGFSYLLAPSCSTCGERTRREKKREIKEAFSVVHSSATQSCSFPSSPQARRAKNKQGSGRKAFPLADLRLEGLESRLRGFLLGVGLLDVLLDVGLDQREDVEDALALTSRLLFSVPAVLVRGLFDLQAGLRSYICAAVTFHR